ncbi:MAG: PEGA domain-containing protein [Methanoregulaceae archaeon]|nr:PEGA domain-containing protein [Methanoregulaceae archaeon]
MKPISPPVILLIIVILYACCVPAGAVLQPFTFRGYVTSTDPGSANLSLLATHTWRCTYDNATVRCGWEAIPPVPVMGTVPSSEVFSMVRPGKIVEASSLGVPGGKWTGIGILSPGYEERVLVATDLFGNLQSLPAPLPGGYTLKVMTEPDCGSCTGSTCPALAVSITILRNGAECWTGVLLPGGEYQYSDPFDQSGLYIKFVSGNASSQLCPNATGGMTGPQPLSVFIVHAGRPGSDPGNPGRLPDSGSLNIFSFPSGARVFLGGEQEGVTPLTLSDLEPGTYSLILQEEGYSPFEKNVTIHAGKRMMVTASLEPIYGSLRIRSSPSRATILVNGEIAGLSPLVVERLYPGEYSITLSKPGYAAVNRTARVNAGQEKLLYIALTPQTPPAA